MDTRYWDSDCFLGWLLDEVDKVDECGAVLEQANSGQALIVTSALTLAEVIKLGKGRAPIPAADAEKIRQVFSRSCISVRNLDRFTAQEARQLVWGCAGVDPKDAVHLATALRLRLRVFNTFDQSLLNLSEKLGDPPMKIERPKVEQRRLELVGEQAAEEDLTQDEDGTDIE